MVLTLGSLNIENDVDFDGIEILPSKNIASFSFPGGTTSKMQNMGRNSERWAVNGNFSGSNMDTDRATLKGYSDNDTTVSFVYNGTRNVKVKNYKEKDFITFWEWSCLLEEV